MRVNSVFKTSFLIGTILFSGLVLILFSNHFATHVYSQAGNNANNQTENTPRYRTALIEREVETPGNFTTRRLYATVVYDATDNTFVGIGDCKQRTADSVIGSFEGDFGDFYSENCLGFFLHGYQRGDAINPDRISDLNLLGPDDVEFRRTAQGAEIIYAEQTYGLGFGRRNGVYIQTNNGNYRSLNNQDLEQNGCQFGELDDKDIIECDNFDSLVDNYRGDLNTQQSALASLASVENPVTDEQSQELSNANDFVSELNNKIDAECIAQFDINNRVIISCQRDGKPVGIDGREDSVATCSGSTTSRGRIWMTVDYTDRQNPRMTSCVPAEEAERSEQRQVSNSQPGVVEGDGGQDGLDALFQFVINTVTAIVWMINWALAGILFWTSLVFFTFLRINPASSEFINVAFEPWRIVVSIANLITLSAFLYTGFRYILGLKTKPINEFILNIIIIALTINFTLFASASFINIAQGFGDVFVGGYAAASGQTGNYWEIMFDNLITGIFEVSTLRCGNREAITGGQTPKECNNNAFFPEFFADSTGDAAAGLIGESVVMVIIGFAIYVMIRALLLSLVRVVGLWMLMVTSPFALAAYYSPIPQLKKLADSWLEWFLNLTFFYPVFVLGLILVGVVSRTFAQAARNSSAIVISQGDGVNVLAQNTAPQTASGNIMTTLLIGIVTIGTLFLLLSFMKFFQSFAKQIYSWAKAGLSGLGKLGSGLTGLIGGGLRAAGGGASALATDRIKKDQQAIKDLDRKIKAKNREIENETDTEKKQDLITQRNRLEEEKLNRQRWIQGYQKLQNIGEATKQAGNNIEYLPTYLKKVRDFPKTVMGNMNKYQEARIAQNSALQDLDQAVALKRMGAPDSAIDPNLLPTVNAILKADSEEKRKGIRQAYGERAYNSKINIKSQLGSDEVAREVSDLASLAQYDDENGNKQTDYNRLSDVQKNQFVDFVSKNIDNPELTRQWMQDPAVKSLISHAYENKLLSEDAEKFIKENAGFYTNDELSRRAAADTALDPEKYKREMNWANVLANPVYAEALFKARVNAVGLQQTIKEFKENGALTGGLSQIADRMASAKWERELPQGEAGAVHRSLVNSTANKMVATGLDENSIIERLMENYDAENEKIDTDQAKEIINEHYQRMFGASSIEEIEKMTLDQLEKSVAGDALMAQEDYQRMSNEDKLLTQQNLAKRLLDNAKITETTYVQNLTGSAVAYQKARLEEKRDVGSASEALKVMEKARQRLIERAKNSEELNTQYKQFVANKKKQLEADAYEAATIEFLQSDEFESLERFKYENVEEMQERATELGFTSITDLVREQYKEQVRARVQPVDELAIQRQARQEFSEMIGNDPRFNATIVTPEESQSIATHQVMQEILSGFKKGMVNIKNADGSNIAQYNTKGIDNETRTKIAKELAELMQLQGASFDTKKTELESNYGSSNQEVAQFIQEGIDHVKTAIEASANQFRQDFNPYTPENKLQIERVQNMIQETKSVINKRKEETKSKVSGIHGDTTQILETAAA